LPYFTAGRSGQLSYRPCPFGGSVSSVKTSALVILDVRDPRHPVEAATWHVPGQKTPEEDAQRDWVFQRNFSAPIRKDPATGKLTKHVAMHYATVYGNTAYLSYRQAGLVTLDVSDIKSPKLLSRLDYLVPGFDDPTMPDSMKKFPLDTTAYGNAHSAKLVPGRPSSLGRTDCSMCPTALPGSAFSNTSGKFRSVRARPRGHAVRSSTGQRWEP